MSKVNRIVVHHLIKSQKSTHANVQLREELLDTSQDSNRELIESFLDELNTIYTRKTTKSHGRFDDDQDVYPFQKFLDTYLNDANDEEFLKMTFKSMELFKSIISNPMATGGYVFFIDYENTSRKPLFSVVVLNNKSNYAIDKDTLELVDNISLDVDKLDMAVQIKLSDLQAYRDVDKHNYLSFTKGKKGITNYFSRFIGCTNYQWDSESTSMFISAMNNFFQASGWNDPKKKDATDRVLGYLEEHNRENTDVNMMDMSTLIAPDNPGDFIDYLNKTNQDINTEFKPDKRVYKSLYRRRFHTSDITLDFSIKLVDTGIIEYNDGSQGSESSLLINDPEGKMRHLVYGDG